MINPAVEEAYKVLGLPTSATLEEAKKKAKQLMRDFHPDRNPGDATAETKFKEVNKAIQTIENPPPAPHFQGGGGFDGINIQDFINNNFN